MQMGVKINDRYHRVKCQICDCSDIKLRGFFKLSYSKVRAFLTCMPRQGRPFLVDAYIIIIAWNVSYTCALRITLRFYYYYSKLVHVHNYI